MAIPKEPRQLMINIMYIVLTALLALNVSAEIFNAFKVVDEGLNASNTAYDRANAAVPALIIEGAKKKPEFQTYADRVPSVSQYSKEFTTYMRDIMDYMIDQAGDKNGVHEINPEGTEGDYIYVKGVRELRGKKDKDITTRLLVNGVKKAGKIVDQPKGPEIKAKISEYRDKFLSLIDEDQRDEMSKKIPLAVDDETWRKSTDVSKKSWSHFNFRQMPLQATLPILNKFINDAKATEAAVLNHLLEQVGTSKDVVLDQFIVISSPKKSYVIRGETYETELSLGATASSKSNTRVSMTVNGRSIPVSTEGVAKWSAPASSVGVKKYTAVASVMNPVTEETESFRKEFEFEVGERSVTVSPTKMNVFYIGVDNPVEVSAAGVPSAKVNVSMGGAGNCSLKKNSDGTYTINCQRPTKLGEFAKVNVSAPGVSVSKDFRVKRIPDPIAKLGRERGGSIGNGPFKAQRGVIAALENFDFEAKCDIQGFNLVRVARRQDPERAINPGGSFNGDAKRLVGMAKPGDTYFFENVKAKCPGDAVARSINDMIFTIK
jgi:gliding motility-associated protein GldM